MSFAGDWADAPNVLPAASAGGLKGLLDRLEEVIDTENAALRSREAIDLVETNRRKSRSLLELSRAARSLQASPDQATRRQLDRVRTKLQQNYDLLGLYLAAAQEVTDILGDALREAESDGTYSAALGSGYGPR